MLTLNLDKLLVNPIYNREQQFFGHLCNSTDCVFYQRYLKECCFPFKNALRLSLPTQYKGETQTKLGARTGSRDGVGQVKLYSRHAFGQSAKSANLSVIVGLEISCFGFPRCFQAFLPADSIQTLVFKFFIIYEKYVSVN